MTKVGSAGGENEEEDTKTGVPVDGVVKRRANLKGDDTVAGKNGSVKSP